MMALIEPVRSEQDLKPTGCLWGNGSRWNEQLEKRPKEELVWCVQAIAMRNVFFHGRR